MKKEMVKEAVRLIIAGTTNISLTVIGATIAQYVLKIEPTNTNVVILFGIIGAVGYLVNRWAVVRICGWIHRRF